jgi:hypothetical protein
VTLRTEGIIRRIHLIMSPALIPSWRWVPSLWNSHVKYSFLLPPPLPTGRQAPLPLEGEGEGWGLIKLQFLKSRKTGYKFILYAVTGREIEIFSTFGAEPFAFFVTEGFIRNLQENLFTSDLGKANFSSLIETRLHIVLT